ncbi:UreD-domain-containing protein [Leucogyrophana mollusca]|uniref:UreD-domain-containing protein n=1 Tax=Leucogyrophana mollusca TaxID=85980 RepID=A0ACB8BTI0_9AGAM|nr:UreD-domain-containing protein [Leucogyrophana mollusca]
MSAFPLGKRAGSITAGHGRIAASLHNSTVVFSELSCAYPLKLLSPHVTNAVAVAIVYMMSYGGGLVGGDCVKLSVDVGKGTKLVLLTQGSTKVFKTRPGKRASAPSAVTLPGSITTQKLDVTLAPQSALFLLPDPVTCFRSASYVQVQKFHLLEDASIIVLDWVSSGRKSLGEEWAFTRYYSINEVFVDTRRVARDVLLLEEPDSHDSDLQQPGSASPRMLKDRLAPYSCYAMLILYGPLTRGVVAEMSRKYQEISVYKTISPERLLWSLSHIDDSKGAVVRVAGIETEDVKSWLRSALRGLEDIVGNDVYCKAFL